MSDPLNPGPPKSAQNARVQTRQAGRMSARGKQNAPLVPQFRLSLVSASGLVKSMVTLGVGLSIGTTQSHWRQRGRTASAQKSLSGICPPTDSPQMSTATGWVRPNACRALLQRLVQVNGWGYFVSYGHRTMNTRLPVRSAIFKHRIARLVLQWVTMRESRVL